MFRRSLFFVVAEVRQSGAECALHPSVTACTRVIWTMSWAGPPAADPARHAFGLDPDRRPGRGSPRAPQRERPMPQDNPIYGDRRATAGSAQPRVPTRLRRGSRLAAQAHLTWPAGPESVLEIGAANGYRLAAAQPAAVRAWSRWNRRLRRYSRQKRSFPMVYFCARSTAMRCRCRNASDRHRRILSFALDRSRLSPALGGRGRRRWWPMAAILIIGDFHPAQTACACPTITLAAEARSHL